MLLRAGCEFHYQADAPNPALLRVQPRDDAQHRVVAAEFDTDRDLPLRSGRDGNANLVQRLVLPAGATTLRFDALVEVPDTWDDIDMSAPQHAVESLPDEVLEYLQPSRYCWSDVLADTAWGLFGHLPPTFARVQGISDWVHDTLTFQHGSSDPLTTAVDVYERKAGVCRDFAQLGLTFCRALNVPARYVFGYLPDVGVHSPDEPMDFCAWFEAYLDDRWWTVDPRNNVRRTGRVVIGRGRDAADCPMATTFGTAQLTGMQVWADEAKPGDVPRGVRTHAPAH